MRRIASPGKRREGLLYDYTIVARTRQCGSLPLVASRSGPVHASVHQERRAEALLDRMLNKIDDLCDERDRGIVGSLVWLPPGLIGGMHAGRRKLRLAKCAGQAYEVCRPIFHSSGVNGLSGLEQATGTFAA